MTPADLLTLDAERLAHLQSWVGRSHISHDEITAAPLRGLSATLDREDPVPQAGEILPALWHWLFFLPQQLQRDIGPDGHPNRGAFLPPVPLPRRMWAGGRLHWQPGNPLRVADVVQRCSRIEAVTHKAGRTGDLLFVLVKHEVHNDKGLALTEEHDIVYRAAPSANDPRPAPLAADTAAAWQREIVPDDVLLFRYSALTFNGHRIHYDRQYVMREEGYPGLVVHGPLIATLLLDLVRRHRPDAFVEAFRFQAVRPAFDLGPLRLYAQPLADAKSIRVWSADQEGWLTMQGSVELA
jgi:3-methylfumaryl-CoA hydratase